MESLLPLQWHFQKCNTLLCEQSNENSSTQRSMLECIRMYELTLSPSSPVDHAMNVAIRFDNTYSQLSNLTIEYSVIHLLKN